MWGISSTLWGHWLTQLVIPLLVGWFQLLLGSHVRPKCAASWPCRWHSSNHQSSPISISFNWLHKAYLVINHRNSWFTPFKMMIFHRFSYVLPVVMWSPLKISTIEHLLATKRQIPRIPRSSWIGKIGSLDSVIYDNYDFFNWLIMITDYPI